MKNADIAKKIVGFITFPAVRHVIAGAVSSTVPQRNALEKVLVFYATFVVSSVIAEATTKHVENKIDDIVAWYNTISIPATT